MNLKNILSRFPIAEYPSKSRISNYMKDSLSKNGKDKVACLFHGLLGHIFSRILSRPCLSPFYMRYPRCCMCYQFRIMAASVKHGRGLEMFQNTGHLMMTLLDNALVFQVMLSYCQQVNEANVYVPDFYWISQNLGNILEMDFYRWKSIYRALRGYMQLLLAESVVEFDNNLMEHNSSQLPGYVLIRFKVLARGLTYMVREENQYLKKLLDLTIQVIYSVLNVFVATTAEDELEKLVCCIMSALF